MPRVNLTPLTEEQSALAAQWVPFTLEVVREHSRLWRSVLEWDHAVSAGFYGLVLGARAWNPTLGSKLPTHLARWVKGELKDEAARWRRRGLTSRNGGHGGPAGDPPLVLPYPDGFDTPAEG